MPDGRSDLNLHEVRDESGRLVSYLVPSPTLDNLLASNEAAAKLVHALLGTAGRLMQEGEITLLAFTQLLRTSVEKARAVNVDLDVSAYQRLTAPAEPPYPRQSAVEVDQ